MRKTIANSASRAFFRLNLTRTGKLALLCDSAPSRKARSRRAIQRSETWPAGSKTPGSTPSGSTTTSCTAGQAGRLTASGSAGPCSRRWPRPPSACSSARWSCARRSATRRCWPRWPCTLDEISGGRLILGIGAGWHQPEFDAFGVPFDHRGGRFQEAMRDHPTAAARRPRGLPGHLLRGARLRDHSARTSTGRAAAHGGRQRPAHAAAHRAPRRQLEHGLARQPGCGRRPHRQTSAPRAPPKAGPGHAGDHRGSAGRVPRTWAVPHHQRHSRALPRRSPRPCGPSPSLASAI